LADCKEFQERSQSFSVAQAEELGFGQFWKREQEIVVALDNHRRQKGYFFAALLATDVIQQTSLMVASGSARVLNGINYPNPEPGINEKKGVVPRKKQLLPYLTECLGQIGLHRPASPEPLTMD
jgi:manganese-dependent inorganic pyrophosphatase